jgi:hypothetical protein
MMPIKVRVSQAECPTSTDNTTLDEWAIIAGCNVRIIGVDTDGSKVQPGVISCKCPPPYYAITYIDKEGGVHWGTGCAQELEFL